MRRILATLALVGALLFGAGSAKADFLQDLFGDGGQSKAEDSFEGVYCQGKTAPYKRNQSCKYGDKKVSKETYDRLRGTKTDTASKSETSSAYETVYCKRKDGSVFSSRLCMGTHEITKAEYDRLKGKKSNAASKSNSSSTKIFYCKKRFMFIMFIFNIFFI